MNSKKLCLTALLTAIAPQIMANDIDVSFGGYVKLDTTLTTNGGSGIHDATGLYNVDLLLIDENAETRYDMSAKQTTFNLTAITSDTKLGEMKAFVEGNFYGEGSFDRFAEASGLGSYDFILRHAYLEVGNFTFGQTWSTFMDLNGLMEQADFGLAAGTVWSRNAQIRYTLKSGEFTYMFALENPSISLDGTDIDGQTRPDIVARVDYDPKWGHVSVAAISRKIEADRSPLNGSPVDDDESGSGFVVTTRIPLSDRTTIVGQYASGEIGFYVGLTGFADAEVISPDELDPLSIDAFSVGLSHSWSKTLRSTVLYSESSVDEGVNPVGAEEYTSLHVNAWYQYSANVSFGLEAQHREATFNDGLDIDLDRVGFHAMYVF